jgi:hypothetical protein
MRDIINSFKAHLYERTASPLIGSFIFYWLICNYKLIVILLTGDLKVEEKFDLIKTIYPQDTLTLWPGFEIHYYTLLGNGLLIPLLITLIYIFLLPIPSKYIYEYWKNKQKEIQKIKQKIEDDTPLTNKQSKEIKQDMINLEIELTKSFSYKDNEIYKLKEELQYKKNEIESLKNQLEPHINKKARSLDDFYNDESHIFNQKDVSLSDKILYFIGEIRGNTYSRDIGNYLNLHPTRVDKEVELLIKEGYILIDEKSSNGKEEHPYYITKKGKEYLVENNYV